MTTHVQPEQGDLVVVVSGPLQREEPFQVIRGGDLEGNALVASSDDLKNVFTVRVSDYLFHSRNGKTADEVELQREADRTAGREHFLALQQLLGFKA